MGKRKQFDRDLAGLPMGQALSEQIKGSPVLLPGKELVAIDQPEERHGLLAQRMDGTVVVLYDLAVLAVGLGILDGGRDGPDFRVVDHTPGHGRGF